VNRKRKYGDPDPSRWSWSGYDEEREVIAKIMQWSAEGMGYAAIARRLTEDKVPAIVPGSLEQIWSRRALETVDLLRSRGVTREW